MNSSPEISIVTVGMNHLSLLKKFLVSLYVTSRPSISFELIYVDNCSKDGTVQYISRNYPSVKIISNQKPKGFSENNNLGVKASKGKYVAIINPDIILLHKSIDSLYEYLEQNPEIGILVPQLLNTDLTVQYSARRFMNIRTLTLRVLHNARDNVKSRIVDRYLLKDLDTNTIQAVDWALGAAMLLRRDYYNELNGFDEDYFLYVEDVDICLRSWKMGRPVVYYPHSVMIHAHQKSSNKAFSKKKLMHLKSMITFFVKHKIFLGTEDIMNYADKANKHLLEYFNLPALSRQNLTRQSKSFRGSLKYDLQEQP